MEIPFKEIEKRLEILPLELKSALESDEIAQKIEKIGKDFGIKNLDRLVEICGYVFLKFLPLKDFQKEIEKEFQLEPQKAEVIKNTLEKDVFKKYLHLIEEKKENSLEKLEKEIDKKLSLLERKIDKKLKQKTEDRYREKIEKKENFGLEMREKGKLKKIF